MKTETMIVEGLHDCTTNRNYRIVIAAPYESQIRAIFMRINEILAESPLIKKTVLNCTKNPYLVSFINSSAIIGFTTGHDASSLRGQKADKIIMDEVDYFDEVCYDAVTAIAAEREGISIVMSSTPTGARSHFYEACTNPKLGYVEHYHPSTHNPNWSKKMEAEFRAQLTDQGFIHEILAEFGTEDMGVFSKDKLEISRKQFDYFYNDLNYEQKAKLERGEINPVSLIYDSGNPPEYNPYRTMGVKIIPNILKIS